LRIKNAMTNRHREGGKGERRRDEGGEREREKENVRKIEMRVPPKCM
jgi:hypothetical protein